MEQEEEKKTRVYILAQDHKILEPVCERINKIRPVVVVLTFPPKIVPVEG